MDIGTGAGDAGWVETDNALRREFVFRNFSEAFGFMISLTTHSAGGPTR
jgi:pterin-4a-carbinolamine dehydratase